MTRIDLHKLKPGEHLTGDRLQRYRSGRMSSEERVSRSSLAVVSALQ